MSQDLKPCPFCGHKTAPVLTSSYELLDEDYTPCDRETFAIICDASRPNGPGGCGGSGGFFMTDAEAISAWNTRAQAPAAEPQWQPIETAPSDELVVVAWWESDETPHYDLDHIEDGCWQRWHDHAEHVEVIGGHGVSYTPPYTHFMRMAPIPYATEAAKDQP